MERERFSVATFNLFNLQDAGKEMYHGAAWTEDQFKNKAWWTAWQLETLNPDVVGLQELWSKTALEKVLAAGSDELKDRYDVLAKPATGKKIVCGALVRKGLLAGEPRWEERFPDAVKLQSTEDANDPQAPRINVTINKFSRPVLNFQVKLRDDEPATEVYVVHLKSKLPTAVNAENWFAADPDLYKPHQTALGAALSTIRRTAEATAVRVMLTSVMKETATPVIVLGDINDGQTSNTANILTEQPPVPRRGFARRRRRRSVHRQDVAGVPRHPRRLLHARPSGSAGIPGPRAGQRAVLRQQPQAALAVRRPRHQQRPPQLRQPEGRRDR